MRMRHVLLGIPPDLVCGLALDVPGLITIRSCGECSEATPCGGSDLCSLAADISEFSGYFECVAPGSKANGETCRASNGGQDCASGHCAVVDVEGILSLDVCGECSQDSDCAGGQICQPGNINTSDFSVSGSECVSP